MWFALSDDINLRRLQWGCCNPDRTLVTYTAVAPDRRPWGYWTDANIRKALEPHIITVQQKLTATPTRYLPTRKALCLAGCTALVAALTARGGMYSATVMNLMNAQVVPR